MWKNENTDSGILRGSFICWTWQLNSRAKENPFSSGERSFLCGWGVWENVFYLILTHCLQRSLISRRDKVNLGMWILRLRLWLRAEWQGGKYTAKSESSRNRETNHREKPNIPIKKGSGAMCIGFWLMLGTSFFDWFMCWVFNKSGFDLGVCSSTL